MPAVSRAVDAQLDKRQIQVLVTNDYAIASVASVHLPTVLYTDAIFPFEYGANEHPWLEGISPLGVWSEHQIVRRALRRVSLAAFASEFARNEALKYGIPRSKTTVWPYGANLDTPPGPNVAASRNLYKVLEKGRIDILFVGKFWDMKGGPITLEVARGLQAQFRDSHVHVVGCEPPGIAEKDFVTVHGYLDKRLEGDGLELDKLYRNCDVLIVPSRAEGYGVVFAEAAAYGLPSLAYDTTGVATAVRHRHSGILLERNADASDFVSVILDWYCDPSSYDALCAGARAHFENFTNWDRAAKAILGEISEISAMETGMSAA
jgi:glycosyltransferase involved in cell wall biosynthesis